MADQDQEPNQKPIQEPLNLSLAELTGKLGAAAAVAREFKRWRKNSHIALDDQFLNALSDLEEAFEEKTAAAQTPQSDFYPPSRYGSKL